MKKHTYTPIRKIRIIGGQWRGRKLPVLDRPGLRPTMDRVRETLFNWLSPFIINVHCLDCFAGSGILGLEALSRYAASVTLLEIERIITHQLRQNLRTLKASNAKIVNINTLAYLAQSGTPYNIVFIDPPFHNKELLEETLILLEKNGWLAVNALIYLENKAGSSVIHTPVSWNLYRKKVSGQVSYCLYRTLSKA